MDDYRVVRQIGKGSYGKVYLAKHASSGALYVIKIVRLAGVPAKEREACRNEVLLMQKLQHPNVVQYRDSFLARDNLCMCVLRLRNGRSRTVCTQIATASRALACALSRHCELDHVPPCAVS